MPGLTDAFSALAASPSPDCSQRPSRNRSPRRLSGVFVGGGPQVASDLYVGSATTGNSIGQANRSVTHGTAHSAGRILFLGDNYETRRNGLNAASDTARNQHILSSLDFDVSSGYSYFQTYLNRPVAHGTGGTTALARIVDVRQNADGLETARLLAFSDLLVVGGRVLSGTLSGTYRYEGVFVSAPSTALSTLRTRGTFSLAANLDDNSFTFTGTTTTILDNQTSRLAVTTGGTVNASTGVLLATEAAYTEGTGTDKTADARLDGRILGVDGGSVAGLFTTTNRLDARYVGGFAGTGPRLATNLSPIGHGNRSYGQVNRSVFSDTTHDAARIVFISDNGTSRRNLTSQRAARNALNVASDTARSQHILSNLGVATTGGATSGNITKFTGVNITHGVSGGTTSLATIWQDSNSTARLFAFGDLLVAGGPVFDGDFDRGRFRNAGIFRYKGVFVSALSTALGTLREGTFSLSANFTNNTFTFTGTTNATPSDSSTTQTSRLAATGSLYSPAGTFRPQRATYTEGTGTGKTADALILGRIYSGADAVAGLFTTNEGSLQNYIGGFVGGRSNNRFQLTAIDRDIDGSSGSLTYGSASGTRSPPPTPSGNDVTSDIYVISPTISSDVSRGQNSVTWLHDALSAQLSNANTGNTGSRPIANHVVSRVGTSDTDVVVYEARQTGRFDLARIYFIDDGTNDRIVLNGPEYDSSTYLRTGAGATSSYTFEGRVSLPRVLSASAAPTNADFANANLTFTSADADSVNFAFTQTPGSKTGVTAKHRTFTITDGDIDLTTGKLSIPSTAEVTLTGSDNASGSAARVQKRLER